MAIQTVTRTHVASIRTPGQVRDDLDSLGFAELKLWNVARWTAGRIWDEIGHIPGHAELSSYLKSHERYPDLNAQSSQRMIQELAEAFKSWYGHRQNGNKMRIRQPIASMAIIVGQRSPSRKTDSSSM